MQRCVVVRAVISPDFPLRRHGPRRDGTVVLVGNTPHAARLSVRDPITMLTKTRVRCRDHAALRELQSAARGLRVTPGAPSDIPGHILGMVSCVRSAIHQVHTVSPAAGRQYIGTALDKWLAR